MQYNASMVKAYQFRLRPTDSQASLFRQHAGCCRHVFNQGLEFRKKAYERRGESKGYGDTVGLLNILKKEKPWLGEAYSQSLQSALRNLDAAYTNFFNNPGKVGYPKFKRKDGRQNLQYPQNCKVDFQEQTLHVPKIGWVPCIFHRRFEGKVKTVTVSIETTGDFYASILVEMEAKPVPKVGMPESDADVLGVDMGIKTLSTCSDGTSYGNGKHLEKSQKRLKKEQRKLSRKKKGSNNRKKQRIKVAKIHQRIANQRQDAIEKATAEIAGKSHAAVAVEDLNVKGMVRNHHLAKAVSDASMSFFLMRLKDKCRAKGKMFVKVDRWYPSSLTCSACGFVNKEVKDLSIREWECPVCHTRHDRDANASLNIASEGYSLMTRLPMDGGEVKPVETVTVDDRSIEPKKPPVDEAGRVLGDLPPEAPRL